MKLDCEVDIPNVTEVSLPNSFEAVNEMEVEGRNECVSLLCRCASEPGISCEKGKWIVGRSDETSEFVKDTGSRTNMCNL